MNEPSTDLKTKVLMVLYARLYVPKNTGKVFKIPKVIFVCVKMAILIDFPAHPWCRNL